MKLNAPKKTTWWIAVILAALGVLSTIISIPVISGIAFWVVVVAFVLLALATAAKNL